MAKRPVTIYQASEAAGLRFDKPTACNFGNGLYLHVAGNARAWFTPYDVPKARLRPGQKRKINRYWIGKLADVPFTKAIGICTAVRDDIKQGIYPEDTGRMTGKPKGGGITFKEYALDRIKHWKQRKNKKDAEGQLNQIDNHCGKINKLGLDDISVALVCHGVLEPLNNRSAMQEEVRRFIRRVLGAAIRTGLRRNKENPADPLIVRDVLGEPWKKPGQIRGPMKALDYPDMPEFMAELRAIKDQSARALEALILSNLRTTPVRFLHIDHLDFDKNNPKWTVPVALMKVDDDGKNFALPMVPRLVDVLQQQIAYLRETFDSEKIGLLFPGDPDQVDDPLLTPISENTMRDVVVKKLKRKATPHGFRASFDTWALNQLQSDGVTKRFNEDAIEYCMAHNPGNKVKRAYRRDQLWKPRVAIMNEWATFIDPTKKRAPLRAVA
jgi:integrase